MRANVTLNINQIPQFYWAAHMFRAILVFFAVASSMSGQVASSMRKVRDPAKPLSYPPNSKVFTLSGLVKDETIGPVSIRGPKHAVYVVDDLTTTRNIVVDGLRATDLQREGIRIRGDADGWKIRNTSLSMRKLPQVPPDLPTGIAIYSGRNIRLENVSVSGFRMIERPKKYTNGDGIAVEKQVLNLTMFNVNSSDNSDGGFDIKPSVIADHLTAERNGRNFRLWNGISAGTLTSVDARKAHIWMLGGNDPHLSIAHLVIRSKTTAPIIWVDNGNKNTVIEIRSCDIKVPSGTKFLVSGAGATMKLGNGCSIN